MSISEEPILPEDECVLANQEVFTGDKLEAGDRLCQIRITKKDGTVCVKSLYAPCTGSVTILHKREGSKILNGSVILSMNVTDDDAMRLVPDEKSGPRSV